VTVVVGGAAYVVATGYFDSGVTVFGVGAGGVLSRTDHDTTELNLLDDRLDGAQALATYSDGTATYLYVGTEFGALSVYRVEVGGTLTLLESLPGAYRDLQVSLIGGAPRLIGVGAGQDVAIYAISATGLLTFDDSFTVGGAGDAGATNAIVTSGGVYLSVAREVEDGFDIFQESIGGDDEIDGRAGDDQIHGGDGADILRGGPGADLIWGDDGDDFLYGGDGEDVLRGGNGDDLLDGGLRNDVLRGGAGEDRLIGGAGADTLYGGSAADILTGGNGLDELFGGIGADELRGGPGADRLVGNNGLDTLIGGSGADVLEGGPGADILDGGGGNDRLKGGSGVDILTGGAGADVFEFALNSGKDTITDFNRAVDRIEISGWTGGYGGLEIVQDGGDVIVSFGKVEITVENAVVGDLDAGAFLFV
jgi:Ca2+-binding RTX toxin-like protein